MIGLPHRANDEPDFRGVKLPICEETFSTYMLPPFEDFGEYNTYSFVRGHQSEAIQPLTVSRALKFGPGRFTASAESYHILSSSIS